MAASSPKKSYQQCCEQMHYKCNTGVFDMLPETYDSLKEVTALDLRRNCLGRNGIKPLLHVISECTNLEVLILADNYLSNDSVPPLCEALQRCRRLAYLDLSGNPISQPAGKLLCRFVDEMASLRRLRLSNTLMNPGLARLAVSKVARRSGESVVVETDKTFTGLRILDEARSDQRHKKAAMHSTPSADRAPEDDWYAMETIWDVAAVAAPPSDGWSGLASVMALVRQDESMAAMFQNE